MVWIGAATVRSARGRRITHDDRMYRYEPSDIRATERRNEGHCDWGGIDLRKNQCEERTGSEKAECRPRPADAGDDRSDSKGAEQAADTEGDKQRAYGRRVTVKNLGGQDRHHADKRSDADLTRDAHLVCKQSISRRAQRTHTLTKTGENGVVDISGMRGERSSNGEKGDEQHGEAHGICRNAPRGSDTSNQQCGDHRPDDASGVPGNTPE